MDLIKKNKSYKDASQTLVLIVMVSLCVVLTVMNLYKEVGKDKSLFMPNPHYTFSDLGFFLMPSKITIRYSKDSTTAVEYSKDKVLKDGFDALRQALLDDRGGEKIPLEDYREKLLLPNLTFSYDSLPAKTLEEAMYLNSTLLEDIASIEKITFLLNKEEEGEVYIFTGENAFYLKKSLPNDFESVENIKFQGYTNYYMVLDYISDSSNTALLSLNPYLDLDKKPVTSQEPAYSSDFLAYKIFQERADFTSLIKQDDGSYLYSYNNGQEILSLIGDELLYKNNSTSPGSITSDEAIKTAMNFLSNLDMEKEYVITGLKENKVDSNQVYNIIINKSVENIPIFVSVEDSIEYIEITNGIISSVSLSISKIETVNSPPSAQNKDLLGPLEILDLNSKKLMEELKYETSKELMEDIKDISLVYYEKKGGFTISYMLDIGGKSFIFSALDGGILANGYF